LFFESLKGVNHAPQISVSGFAEKSAYILYYTCKFWIVKGF